ncbi:MAG: heat-inducible transcriptional repressor HrcA [Anaerolineae bacterium]|nr:heat-inducible transcriptional repressor HrcA [Anaerolineae bacterium]
MESLSERQKLILGLVVQEYVETAKPVGSKKLVERFDLELSSATVRTEMSALCSGGFLRQPHTSAGRIPTEEGYRFFVGELMQRPTIPESVRHTISHQFYQARHDVDQWMRLAASVLAARSQAVSLVTSPQSGSARFKHLELILTTGRQVLMVVVLMNGEVRQQMLVLSETVTQEKLSSTADQFNRRYSGKATRELLSSPKDVSALEQDIFRLVTEEINRTEMTISGEVYQDGWSNVLAEPEFSASEDARKAIRVFEERPLLDDLLTQTVMNSDIGGVQVLIGGEGTWEELSDFSLVLARYGTPELATGFLGVLGPLRMSYGNAITTVNFIGGLLSNLISETMGNGSETSIPQS